MKIKIKNNYRFQSLQENDITVIDDAKLILRMSLSSEFPVKRYDFYSDREFYEVLSHDINNIDLKRCIAGGAFRDDHYGDQVGVMSNPAIENNKLYVDVTFSADNERAKLIYNDMKNGIRRNVSIRPEYTGDGVKSGVNRDDNLDIVKFPWSLIHGAVVPDPADPTVGMGRSFYKDDNENNSNNNNFITVNYNQQETVTMDPELRSYLESLGLTQGASEAEATTFMLRSDIQTQMGAFYDRSKSQSPPPAQQPQQTPAPAINRSHVTYSGNGGNQDPVIAERHRIAEISELGRSFNMDNEAKDAVTNGASLEVFRENVLAKVQDRSKVTPVKTGDGNMGLSNRDLNNYSMLRAINLIIEGKPLDGLEAECSQEVQRMKGGTAPNGFYVPTEVTAQRNLNTTNSSTLVNTDTQSSNMIDVLRNSNVLTDLGVQIITGLQGDVEIPVKTGTSQYYFVSEGKSVGESGIDFGQLALTPKTCGTYVDFSRRLLLQSSLGIENMVRADIMSSLGLSVQDMLLFGTGSNGQPLGLLKMKGITNISAEEGIITNNGLIDLETAIECENAATSSMRYLTNSRVKGTLKKTFLNNNSDIALWGKDDTLNGYKAVVTNSVPHNLGGKDENLSPMIFGDFSQLKIAFWSGIDVTVDNVTLARSGSVRISALMDYDIANCQKKAFATIKNIKATL